MNAKSRDERLQPISLEFDVKPLTGSFGREHRSAGARHMVRLRVRRIPKNHNGVADELVDRPALSEERFRQH